MNRTFLQIMRTPSLGRGSRLHPQSLPGPDPYGLCQVGESRPSRSPTLPVGIPVTTTGDTTMTADDTAAANHDDGDGKSMGNRGVACSVAGRIMRTTVTASPLAAAINRPDDGG